ncbi:hypothetical protein G9A89_019353 [Geosiphon pyriformis]|nr:hypothetical protein G9A89_019353 [Geosiphon pyriformis]
MGGLLKGTMTQSPIFAIGSVIKNALEKDQKLWLVLQNMRKAYNLVGWEHLKKSLVRIKMCCKFIRFFGDIHGGHINQVMIDFGLTNGYHIHDGLDQGEVFLLLLWHIFYDPLLCEVKKQESVCVGSSQAATQLILNVASEFFCINDISINNDKTVAIPINIHVSAPSLFISGSPISIAKSGELHHYLGIFLLSKGLCLFFTNLVLKKAVLDKQFLYLVSAVLHPIIGYRTQFSFVPVSVYNKWDALIHKGLKSKSGLPLDFPSDTIHHPFFYGLKSFAQIQSESKVTSLICFANSVGILGRLFFHSPFRLCGGVPMSAILDESRFIKFFPSLWQYGIVFVNQLCDQHGAVFDWYKFKWWKRLAPCGLTPEWFVFSVKFLLGMFFLHAPSFALVGEGLQNIFDSSGSVLVHDQLS